VVALSIAGSGRVAPALKGRAGRVAELLGEGLTGAMAAGFWAPGVALVRFIISVASGSSDASPTASATSRRLSARVGSSLKPASPLARDPGELCGFGAATGSTGRAIMRCRIAAMLSICVLSSLSSSSSELPASPAAGAGRAVSSALTNCAASNSGLGGSVNRKALSSSAIARAVGYRSAGFAASERLITATSAGGRSGFTLSGAG
jgi:hypothetical protein